jgi:uroporphyrinogen decarboxylase
MTSRERIYKTIKGESVDRIPFSLWRHFPDNDSTNKGLAEAIIGFQKKFDFDLVKITPASGYLAEAFGGKFVSLKTGLQKGIRECVDFPIKNRGDWKKIKPIDINQKILKRELEALKLIKKAIGNDVPIVQTIPNPLTLAKTIRGESIFDDLREHPEDLKSALSAITQTILDFSLASLEAGADGIFFFTQTASFDLLTEKEYQEFGVPYDLLVLNALGKKSDLSILHVHGLNIMFDLLKNYPVQIINWHDQLTAPSIIEGQKDFSGAILGGIEESEFLLNRKPEEIKQHIKNIIQQTGGKRLIIGPGCVLPLDIPEENIKAVKEALE